MNKCNPKKGKTRHRINLALDAEVWSKFQTALKERWQDSFNSWVEFAMTCYLQENCADCPYVDDEDKGKGYKPAGIGKNSNE
jgi:MoaA/NifB/PqqE/SkfB family radical SAM enzyme